MSRGEKGKGFSERRGSLAQKASTNRDERDGQTENLLHTHSINSPAFLERTDGRRNTKARFLSVSRAGATLSNRTLTAVFSAVRKRWKHKAGSSGSLTCPFLQPSSPCVQNDPIWNVMFHINF